MDDDAFALAPFDGGGEAVFGVGLGEVVGDAGLCGELDHIGDVEVAVEFTERRRRAGKAQVDYHLMRTDEPVETALGIYLTRRHRQR